MKIVLASWTLWRGLGPLDVCGLSFENHHSNLCSLLCRSYNFNSQSSLSLQLHHSLLVCWWLAYQLYHMLSLMNNWSKTIVSSDFLVLSKCWNGPSYLVEISRVKDDEYVCHLPVVCSPWWYSVSDAESMMMGLWGQWEGWGKTHSLIILCSVSNLYFCSKISTFPLKIRFSCLSDR